MYGSTSNMDNYRIDFADGEGPSTTFDSAQFSRICDNITSNIYAITRHASTLEKTLKVIGSVNDSKEVRESVHVIQVTANATVNSTTEEFRQLRRLVSNISALPNNGRDERNRENKLSTDFQTALKRYHGLQKEIVAKMKTTLLRVESHTSSMGGGEADDQSTGLIDEEAQRQAQVQLQQNLEFEQGLLLEREERIREIESDILDINSIMKQLGGLVSEQGDVIDTIEDHIGRTYTDVDTGREELQKAASYQTKYRKRLLWLLAIGFIVLVIVVTILVTTLRH